MTGTFNKSLEVSGKSDKFWDAFQWDLRDKRVDGWPLMSTIWPTVSMSVLYIVLVTTIGPWVMQNRKALDVKRVVLAYNALQITISVYLVYGLSRHGWLAGYDLVCQDVDRNPDPSSDGFQMAAVGWYMLVFRFTEYFDTFFFIARKKFSHVSALQVIHHSLMPIYGWVFIRFVPGGQDSVVGLINAFVHVIMYTYYLLAAIGPQMQPYLWWKRYLTKLQLVQFVVGFAHSFVVAAGLVQCGYPWQFCAVTCSVLALMMLLFGHFYFEEYVRKKANKQA